MNGARLPIRRVHQKDISGVGYAKARFSLLFEHDLFGKPVPTFPDRALEKAAMQLSKLDRWKKPGVEPRKICWQAAAVRFGSLPRPEYLQTKRWIEVEKSADATPTPRCPCVLMGTRWGRDLCQRGRVVGRRTCFREVRARLLGMG
jgi:hypothetical protein